VDVELRQTPVHRQTPKRAVPVLLTTHYLEEAEALCSRIAMLKQGWWSLAQTSEHSVPLFQRAAFQGQRTAEALGRPGQW
jgi:ABC-type multidrug transport system ATPase subunit